MGIHVKYFNKEKFFGGLILVYIGICMPYFLTINTFGIPEQTYNAIVTMDKMELWTAAVKLVALNSIRAFPHYIGAFVIAESIEVDRGSRVAGWMKAAIVCVIIPPVYILISTIHHIRYDFGIPALALIFLLFLLGKRDYNYVSLWKKAMLIMVLLSALQFLDIMPGLEGWPIGRGEMSQEVKLVADFLEMKPKLDVTALVFFCLLLFMGLLLFLLIRDENNLREMSELKKQNERMVMDTKLRVLENRTYIELRHLVHDLKSPLTSAQGLVGVVRMSCERDGMEKECEYLDRVEGAIERMSGMISEILYETHRSRITTEEIMNSVLSQISISEYSKLVHVENLVSHRYLRVNKVRFTRALVNLIENSFYALPEKNGRIDITIAAVEPAGAAEPVKSIGKLLPPASDEKAGPARGTAVLSPEQLQFSGGEADRDGDIAHGEGVIRIGIRDNGMGIDEDTLKLIWESGFSTRDSHGLGLSFVKKVVTNAGGRIKVESTVGRGTYVELLMPEESEEG